MIRAIETRYAGCRFRSRLEARWAVFFDTLQIPWEYEPEGFETSNGPYLPDFRLKLNKYRWSKHDDKPRRREVFFEVKADNLRHTKIDSRWPEISEVAGGLYVVYGLPKLSRSNIADRFSIDGFPISGLTEDHIYRIWPNGECDAMQYFAQCPYCLDINISFAGGLLEELPAHAYDGDILMPPFGYEFKCCKRTYEGGLMYHGSSGRIMRAYDTARSARFEHDKTGLSSSLLPKRGYTFEWQREDLPNLGHGGI